MPDDLVEDIEDEKVEDKKPAAKSDPPAGKSVEDLEAEITKIQKALKKANAEAQANRQAKQRLEELEEERERREQDQLPELEKLQKKVADFEKAAKERAEEAKQHREELLKLRLDREVEGEARKAGADPEQAALMLRGMSNNGIDYDEDLDKFVGVSQSVSKLIQKFPSLLVNGGVTRGRGTPPREKADQRDRQTQETPRIDVEREGLSRHVTYESL